MIKTKPNRMDLIKEPGAGIFESKNPVMSVLSKSIILVCIILSSHACTEPAISGFDPSKLNQLGDSVHYGSYIIYKIGEDIYKINDPGDPEAILGGLIGTDIYLICGEDKALMIDLGNNYIDGFTKDLIKPRENAKEEFLDVVNGIIGKLPLEAVVSHMHPDHDGMAKAFIDSEVSLWVGEGENLEALRTQHNLDPSVFQTFRQGEKSFDLGGGRIVETFLLRGHSNGGTVFLLKPDMMLFTGDAISPGPRRKRELRSAEALSNFTADINHLVNHIKENLAPYDRYRLQVYTGHSGEMIFHATKTDVIDNLPEDTGYGEWRFVQDMANVANAVKDGTWLDATMGFHHFEVPAGTNNQKQIQIVFYLGALILPEDVAYGASGMKVPEAAGIE
jgi:glyoxylase-like metal-dependent hydrolase (beta-lactamase superfamily II)